MLVPTLFVQKGSFVTLHAYVAQNPLMCAHSLLIMWTLNVHLKSDSSHTFTVAHLHIQIRHQSTQPGTPNCYMYIVTLV